MDQSKDGQNNGMVIEAGSSDLQPKSNTEKSKGESEEEKNDEFMNGKWKHDQKIDFSNVVSGLNIIKAALEKARDAQKAKLVEMQSKISQFNK